MSKILYGVQGDSNGHISRSLSVAEMLAGHEFLFVGGGSAIKAREAGYSFEPLPLIGMDVKNNAVHWYPTVTNFVHKWWGRSQWLRRMQEVITAFDPDLIITDNEFFTPRAAHMLGRPCFSLDHQHVLSRTRYTTPAGQGLSKGIATTLMHFFLPDLAGCIMTSFHQPPLIDPVHDSLFGTLPRPDARAMTASKEEHALMYLPGCDRESVLALFGGRQREYRLYGLGAQPAKGNITFCGPDRGQFLSDLASAAYIVSRGGHGLLSEALLLGKPCLCFPSSCMFEQYWNCFFVQENGYGQFHTSMKVDPRTIDTFEASLDTFAARAAVSHCTGHEQLTNHMEALLRK